jgi:hypothetical protein
MSWTGNSSLLRPPAVVTVCFALGFATLTSSGTALAADGTARAPDPAPSPAQLQPDPYNSASAPTGRTVVPSAPVHYVPVHTASSSSTSRPGSPTALAQQTRKTVTSKPHTTASFRLAGALPRWTTALADPPALAVSERTISAGLALAVAAFALLSGAFVIGIARRAETQ